MEKSPFAVDLEKMKRMGEEELENVYKQFLRGVLLQRGAKKKKKKKWSGSLLGEIESQEIGFLKF